MVLAPPSPPAPPKSPPGHRTETARVMKRKRRRPRLRWWVYLVLLPTFALLGFMSYYPALSGIWHSFYDWQPGFHSTFTGLQNYRDLWHDSLWWQSFRNLGVIFIATITVMWIFPILAAELIITLKSERARFIFRTLLIIPLAFPAVVTALIWSFLYNPNDGLINHFLGSIGLSSWEQNWVGNPHTALGSLLAIGFPWIAGLPFLIFLSTLQNIPSELMEAAALDGAGRFRRFLAIDLPLMAQQIRLLFFLAFVTVLQYGFAAYLVTSGGPDNSTTVPALRMIGVAFQAQRWGYAAAMATTLFAIAILGSVVILVLGGLRGRRDPHADAKDL